MDTYLLQELVTARIEDLAAARRASRTRRFRRTPRS